MMSFRTAVISDIHGNLEGLQSVLQDIRNQRIQRIICLGDIVGYGPDPVKCLEELNATADVVTLMGNHEAMLLGLLDTGRCSKLGVKAVNWVKQVMAGSPWLAFLRSLPHHYQEDNIMYTHTGLSGDRQWSYLNDLPSIQKQLSNTNSWITFYGHTHRHRITSYNPENADGDTEDYLLARQEKVQLSPNRKYYINPGSVGQARSDKTCADYLIFEQDSSDGAEIWFRHLSYPSLRTYKKMILRGIDREQADYLVRERGRKKLYGFLSYGWNWLYRDQIGNCSKTGRD